MKTTSDPQDGDSSNRFDVRATASDHFAWLRTRLALERTMMAYLRTAVSLIGFGFAIVQFFERFEEIPGANAARFPEAPRYLGLAMIVCGVLVACISLMEYRWIIRYLWSGKFTAIAGMGMGKDGMQIPLIATAIVLIAIGTFAFFAVVLRLL